MFIFSPEAHHNTVGIILIPHYKETEAESLKGLLKVTFAICRETSAKQSESRTS